MVPSLTPRPRLGHSRLWSQVLISWPYAGDADVDATAAVDFSCAVDV